jgi:hypothetical protein
MALPRFVQTTSTDKPLKKGPADMPDRGGPKPDAQITSTQISMGRKDNFVAANGAHPGMGEVQCESTKVKLSRTPNSPYQSSGINATKPQSPFGRKKGK